MLRGDRRWDSKIAATGASLACPMRGTRSYMQNSSWSWTRSSNRKGDPDQSRNCTYYRGEIKFFYYYQPLRLIESRSDEYSVRSWYTRAKDDRWEGKDESTWKHVFLFTPFLFPPVKRVEGDVTKSYSVHIISYIPMKGFIDLANEKTYICSVLSNISVGIALQAAGHGVCGCIGRFIAMLLFMLPLLGREHMKDNTVRKMKLGPPWAYPLFCHSILMSTRFINIRKTYWDLKFFFPSLVIEMIHVER